MPKQLNVSLGFQADTGQAESAIKQLTQELDNLGKNGSKSVELPITKSIQEAQAAAKQLGDILQNSFDKNSNSLDLSAFNNSLRQSGMSLTDYGKRMMALGPEGEQAFLKVARSIVETEAPLKRSSAMLTEFGTTLKNAARWQISSSVLHGFMGALQSAYGYAQNLNESLNNIRIVTGYSTEQMAQFAEQANKSAQALSTTTNRYTNASLTYYQQGLSDAEVKARTDTTVKMANVSKQSAEDVADQMTAIWNNFDDGSKSLEYYADVITALGAATASSSEEIATGLEKFAANAETAGLSYEYATAALATITAATRQSADVVGTAFKTLLARMQSLKIGEKLEDGTDLTKYSQALETVGVKVKDAKGELRDMDDILTDLGSKWQSLGRDTQTALAQTLAGNRQYTQLVALMDNQDKFQENLQVAQGSTGTLQKQADIYAESWEASSARVRAAWEEIYSTVVNGNFFIALTDGFATFLGDIENAIQAIGGFKGVLSLVGVVVSNLFGAEIANGINNLIANLGGARKELTALQDEAYKMAMAMTTELVPDEGTQALRNSLTTLYKLQQDYNAAVKDMTPAQQAAAQAALNTTKQYADMAIEMGKARQALLDMQEAKELQYQGGLENVGKLANLTPGDNESITKILGSGNELQQNAANILAVANQYDELSEAANRVRQALRNPEEFDILISALRDLGEQAQAVQERFNNFKEILESGELVDVNSLAKTTMAFKDLEDRLATVMTKEEAATQSTEELVNSLDQVIASLGDDYAGEYQDLVSAIEEYKKALAQVRQEEAASPIGTATEKSLDNLQQKLAQVTSQLNEIPKTQEAIAQSVEQALSGHNITLTPAMREETQAFVARLVSANQNADANERLAGSAKNAEDAIKHLGLAYQDLGTAISASVQGASKLVTAWNALSSIKDTLNDHTLSSWEKFTRIITSLGTAIPMAMTGFTQLKNSFQFFNASLTQGLTATGKLNAGVAATSAASIASAGAINVETGSILKNTGALLANLAARHPLILAIGATALAIWGISKALDAAYERSPEGQLEAAKEKATQLTSNLEQVKAEAQEIKSAFNNYDSVVDKLNNCTYRTEEWKKALTDVNNEVLDLMAKYPELASMVNETTGEKAIIRGDNGQLKIADWAKKTFEDRANLAVQSAQMASIMANQDVRNRELDIDIAARRNAAETKLAVPMYKESALGGYGVKVEGENGLDFREGQFQGLSELIIDSYEKLDKSSNEALANSLLDLISANYDIDKETLDKDIIDVNMLVDAVRAAKDDLKGLQSAINTNSEVTRSENEILAQQLLSDNYKLNNSQYYDQISKALGTSLGNITAREMDVINKTYDGINKNSKVTDSAVQQLWKDYQNKGFTSESLKNIVEENGQIKLETDSGKLLDLEVVKSQIALINSQEQLSDTANSLSDAFKNLNESGDEATEALAGFVGKGDLLDATSSQIEQIKTDIANSGRRNATEEERISSYLQNKLGMSDSQLQTAFGEKYIDNFKNQLNNFSQALDSTMDSWSKGTSNITKEHLNELRHDKDLGQEFDKLTGREQNRFADAYHKIFEGGGEKALQGLEKILNSNKDKAADIEKAFSKIDTSNFGSISEFKQALNDLGVVVDDSYISELERAIAVTASFDLSNVTEQLGEVLKTLKSLTAGSELKPDDFKKLGLEDFRDFFVMTDEGMLRLIGDAEAFNDAVKDKTIKKLKENIEGVQIANEAIKQQHKAVEGVISSAKEKGISREDLGSNASNLKNNKADIVQAQLDLLKESGYNLDQLRDWQNALDNNKKAFLGNVDALGAIAVASRNAMDASDGYQERIEQNTQAIRDETEQLMYDAIAGKNYKEGLEALNALQKEMNLDDEQMAIGKHMLSDSIAEQTTNLGDLIEALQRGEVEGAAFDNKFRELGKALDSDIKWDDVENLAAYIQQAGAKIAGLTDKIKEDKTACVELAKAVLRYNAAVTKVTKNLSKWQKSLKSKDIDEQREAVTQLRDAFGDLLDIDGSALSEKFVTNSENIELLKKAIKGDSGAYQELNAGATQDQIVRIVPDFELGDTSQFTADVNSFLNSLDVKGIKVGMELDDESTGVIVGKINDALGTIEGLTAEQAAAISESLADAYDIDLDVDSSMFEVSYVPAHNITSHASSSSSSTSSITATSTSNGNMPMSSGPMQVGSNAGQALINANWAKAHSSSTSTVNATSSMNSNSNTNVNVDPVTAVQQLPLTKVLANPKGKPRRKGGTTKSQMGSAPKGKGGKGGGGGGGGGGGKSNPSKPVVQTPKSDMAARYHEIDHAIKDVTKAYQNASKAADRLYGKERLDQMKKQEEEMQKHVDLLDERNKKTKEYLAEDTDRFVTAFNRIRKDFGENTMSDLIWENGRITNYEQITNELWQYVHTVEETRDKMIASGASEDSVKEYLDGVKYDWFKELYAELAAAAGMMHTDMDTLDEDELAKLDLIRQIQQSRYDRTIMTFNLKIEANDNDRKLLELIAEPMKDNIYRRIEYAVTMSSSPVEDLINGPDFSKSRIFLDLKGNADATQELFDTLHQQYAASEIDKDSFVEGMQEVVDATYTNIEALREYDRTMGLMFAETVPMATEEMDRYTSRIEYCSTVLEHFQKLLDLTGRKMDFRSKGTVFQAQADVLKDRFDVATEEYYMYKDRLAEAEEAYERAMQGNDKTAQDYARQNLDAITEATQEAYEERLSYAEQYAEALRAILTNTMDEEYKWIENMLTNNRGYDALMTQIDRLKSHQDEFLTRTQQAYEANKLLRQMQNDLDNTSNRVSQERIKLFMEETKALGEREELSNHELEIQQKRYDLLLAELALEDARNAKNNLTLQRDSQGNYSYVYTADQDEIDKLQQDYDDKYMNLYNTLLNGSEDYLTKYAELLKERYEKIRELQEKAAEDEIYAQTQYEQDKLELRQYYDSMLIHYQEMYDMDMMGLATGLNMAVDLENGKFCEDQITRYGALTTGILDLTDEMGNQTTEKLNLMRESWTVNVTAITGLIIGPGENGRASLESSIYQWQAANQIALELVDEAIRKYKDTIHDEVAPVVGEDLDKVKNKTNDVRTASKNLRDYTVNTLIPTLNGTLSIIQAQTNHYLEWRSAIDGVINRLIALNREAQNAKNAASGFFPDSTKRYEGDLSSQWVENYRKQLQSDEDSADFNYYSGEVSAIGDQRTDRLEDQGEKGKKHLDNDELKRMVDRGFDDLSLFGAENYDYFKGTDLVKEGYNTTIRDRVVYNDKNEWWDPEEKKWKSGPVQFATGGYTGEWGPQGKLAVLDEKELVLNSQDTSNILAVVDIVRDIVKSIDAQVSNAKTAFFDSILGTQQSSSNLIDQHVEITANFPDATDREEIQAAINGLINQAAQYAGIRGI